jgi:hypothetical protein
METIESLANRNAAVWDRERLAREAATAGKFAIEAEVEIVC